MVGMVDGIDEELLSNFIQLLYHVYRPALESLLFFADEGPEKTRVYEEVLMAIQSLYSSLKGEKKIPLEHQMLFNTTQFYFSLGKYLETRQHVAGSTSSGFRSSK